jgi:hypothetical protein
LPGSHPRDDDPSTPPAAGATGVAPTHPEPTGHPGDNNRAPLHATATDTSLTVPSATPAANRDTIAALGRTDRGQHIPKTCPGRGRYRHVHPRSDRDRDEPPPHRLGPPGDHPQQPQTVHDTLTVQTTKINPATTPPVTSASSTTTDHPVVVVPSDGQQGSWPGAGPSSPRSPGSVLGLVGKGVRVVAGIAVLDHSLSNGDEFWARCVVASAAFAMCDE